VITKTAFSTEMPVTVVADDLRGIRYVDDMRI
jgi:hypothetical protein